MVAPRICPITGITLPPKIKKKLKKAKAIRILENRQRLIVNKQALNEESVDLKNLRKAFQHFIYFCFHLTPQLGNNFFFFSPFLIQPTLFTAKATSRLENVQVSSLFFPMRDIGPWFWREQSRSCL